MKLFEGLALGLLQGLTEFLPVSSSGHLLVLKSLFGYSTIPVLFDIALHLATLASVVVFFRKRIGELFISLFRFLARRHTSVDAVNLKTIVALLIGTAITAVIGLSIEKLLPAGNLKFASVCFFVTACILVLAEWLGRRQQQGHVTTQAPGIRHGIISGIAQGIGVLPGISRSGITISAGIASGLDRNQAGEFSFLLSIPAIFGAFILELKDADTLMDQVAPLVLASGMITAFVSGLLALLFLMGLVRRGKLSWFAVYLVPLAIISFFFL